MSNEHSVEDEYAAEYGTARAPLRKMLADSIQRQRSDLAALTDEYRSLAPNDKRAPALLQKQRDAASALKETMAIFRDEQRKAGVTVQSAN